MSILVNDASVITVDNCSDESFAHFTNPTTDYTVSRRWKEVLDNNVPISDTTRSLTFQVQHNKEKKRVRQRESSKKS